MIKKKIDNELLISELSRLSFLRKEERTYLENIKVQKDVFKVCVFQQNLQNLLAEYLNTPWILSSKISLKYELLAPFFHENELLVELDKVYIKNLPEVIKIGYKFLDELIDLTSNKEEKKDYRKIIIPRIQTQNYSANKVLSEFISFSKENLSPYIDVSFIHGSCADNSIVNYSDLDTFMVINRNTILNLDELKSLKSNWLKSLKYLYLFDALQHHSHMFCTEIDLKFYPSNWLPPVAFSDGVCMSKGNVVELYLIKTNYNKVINFFNLVQRFRNESIKSKIYNEYSFKNDISVIYLFPALFLQSLGKEISKKDSFNDSSLNELDMYDFFVETSEIRNNWKTSLISDVLISKKYNFFVRKYYLRFFMKKEKNNVVLHDGKMKDYFLDRLNNILNKMSNIIINN
jgi:hypothetical protein